ncbi:apolipoprotein N-acyltransferase [Acrocarpospora phusangensis]|uniref:Apolipoprotein N-acyltransferase n=1 Tax=Acrocarpospora phusangensis TaxID=1070424 RepID=A0A919QDS1_9ACTN|nr:nitrilase-related carbon-nitrogen hydrolase [Acrocarpospora phusangensis]GIH25854.1 apolipoprotein N-acyltransferase [Acrocarpospora phusangensis]
MERILLTLASAVLMHFGTGLHPLWWLTWLAPLPVLFLARRSGPRTAFAAGTLVWITSQAQMWPYFTRTLEMPPALAAALIAGPALCFGLAVLLFRALLVRGRPVLAAAAVPAVWVSAEYVMNLAGPHGAWWSLAYTQADFLPVLQTASVTGVWGITFLLLFVPASVAALRPRAAVVSGVLVALTLGHGVLRLATPADTAGRKVALIATDAAEDPVRHYGEAMDAAVAGGAEVVVLPEKVFKTADLPFTRPGVDVVAGIALDTNSALAYPSGVRYDKHHMIPGLERRFRPGTSLAFLGGGRLGLIICKDLDFPGLVREYGKAGVAALLAPAWDFGEDGWLHSRMAVVRGVENGFAVARAAREGLMTVSDNRGRVLAERRSGGTVTAGLPREGSATVYTALGDWAAWASAGLLLLALGTTARLSFRARRGTTTSLPAPSPV